MVSVPSSTPASAIIYDACISIIKKKKNCKVCVYWWSSGQRVWLGNERFEFDDY